MENTIEQRAEAFYRNNFSSSVDNGNERINYTSDTYLAMIDFAKSELSNHLKALKWVLSSERLPQMEKFLVFKDNVGIYRTGNFYQDGNKKVLAINGTPNYDEFLVLEEHFNHYYWLEDFSELNSQSTKP